MKVQKTDSESFAVNRYVHEDRFPAIWHFHDEYELTLILESNGTRMVGDHIDSFAAGDLIFIGKNLPHTWRNEGIKNYKKAEALVLHFLEDMWGHRFFESPEMKNVLALLERSHRGIRITGKTKVVLTELLLAMEKTKGIEKIRLLLSLLDILSTSEDLVELSSEVFVKSIEDPGSERLRKIYEYIMNNFHKDINLVEVAEVAHMSPSAFSRYFKSRMRKPFRQFIIELKVGYACKLLMQEDRAVTEVCYESGFQNLSNFNEQFKKITGLTPKKYQLTHTNK
ncbi:AraC family transcriptional regulator [Niabella ginsenosidivorans]|nr:AraC family transcriptional regulator [Niabella ginsenosidivorans]